MREHFVPARAHVKTEGGAFERFGVKWTPTVLVLGPDGEERRRLEGFLPPKPFLGTLALGLGHADFAAGRFAESEHRFDEVTRHHGGEIAAEATYWRGVARYKKGGDASALAAAARELGERWPESLWTARASPWTG